MEHKNDVTVEVEYVGHHPWHHNFDADTTVNSVKVKAMTEGFGLEASAADKYALQYNGTDMPGDKAIGTYQEHHMKTELILIKEPNKGL